MSALVFAFSAFVLLSRRPHPLVTLVLAAAALTVAGVAAGWGDGLAPLLPLVIGYYSVARWAADRELVAATAAVVVAVALHLGLDPHYHPGPALGLTLLPLAAIVAGGVVGRVLRLRARAGQRLARTAVVAERQRIAHELHDLVGHGLSVIAVQAMAARTNIETGAVGAADAKLAAVERTARSTLEEMRRLVTLTAEPAADLSPPPRLTDLERLVEPVRQAGVPVTVTVEGSVDLLAPGLELAVYRIVQESLTNALKHASRPLTLSIALRVEGADVVVEVCDSGRSVTAPVPGRGITGMIERASLYGGTVAVTPGRAGGMRVQARFPRAVIAS